MARNGVSLSRWWSSVGMSRGRTIFDQIKRCSRPAVFSGNAQRKISSRLTAHHDRELLETVACSTSRNSIHSSYIDTLLPENRTLEDVISHHEKVYHTLKFELAQMSVS